MSIDVTKKIHTHIAFIYPYQFPFYQKKGYVISFENPTAFGTFRAVKTTVVENAGISATTFLQQKKSDTMKRNDIVTANNERLIKFKIWLPNNKIMMRPKDIIEIQESQISNVTIGQMKGWVWLQYIGLNDKNNNEIYEDDILKVKTESSRLEYFVVKWGIHRREMKSGWTVDIPGYSFVSAEGFRTFPIVNNYLNGHDLDVIEIVGNVYQNPELLDKVSLLPTEQKLTP